MKLITRLLILACLSLLASSFNLKVNKKEKTEVKEDFSKQWTNLFSSLVRPSQLCVPPQHMRNDNIFANGVNGGDSGVATYLPKPKANRWAKMQGFGASAYLFDYWDELFQQDLITQFNQMFTAAKAIQPADPSVYQDPYTLDKMIFYYSQGAKAGPIQQGQQAPPTQGGDLMAQIQKYNKNINPAVWQNSISAGQLYSILQQWGWEKPVGTDYTKKLLDAYDFDGDGRLNPTEFVLLSIINNLKLFRKQECKQFCYNEILLNKIDALFAFLDCDSDGFVSAENMWIGLVNLKRRDPTKFSMYTCQMPSVLNKGYRTTSCNDFILKNYHRADGFVDLDEFRAGVLLGYWDRHTDSTRIIPDDSKNLKNFRWAENGAKDIVCDSILALVPKEIGGGAANIPPPAAPAVNNSTPK